MRAGPQRVEVRLLPPLSTTAGCERVKLELEVGATVGDVIDALVARFDDPRFRLHLFDTEGRLIPAWRVFFKGGSSVSLGSRNGPGAQVVDGEELTFLLSLAGG